MRQVTGPFIRMTAVLIAVLMLSSCGAVRPTGSRGESGATTPAAVTDAPAAHPASQMPTALAMLDIDGLPSASLDPATLTSLCDASADAATIDAGEATITCTDGLMLGLRAIATVATGHIDRLYLRRPACPTAPCTEDQLNTATVTGSTTDGAFSVGLDSRLTTVEMPVRDPSAVWPANGSSSAPAVARPVVDGAPREVAGRTPYPYCGTAEVAEPARVLGCFRDAVLAGRPAEVLQRVFGTEGGAITWLFRFDGHGAVLRYSFDSGRWFRQAGSMDLGATPSGWDFVPWPETETNL